MTDLSGSYDWNPAVTFIITSALRKLGAISEDEVPTAGMMSDGLFVLNSIVKELEATGIHVWTEQEWILFLQPGQNQYQLGPGSTDHSADANSWLLVQLLTNAPALASSVTLQSALGVTSGQNIGIQLDAGPTFWTTVSGAPSGNIVALTASLPSSASAQNNGFVYTTPTQLVRPLKVPSVRRLIYKGLLETPLTVFSRQEYMDTPNKRNPGIPTQFFYAPLLGAGQLYLWPTPQNSQSGARFTAYWPLQNFNTIANTAEFPQEWINTLIWLAAKELAPDFDTPPPRYSMILQQAEAKMLMVESWDRESEPIQFQIGYDGAQRY